MLDYTKHIIFPALGRLEVVRPEEHGGTVVYDSFEALEKDFGAANLHPKDLKESVASAINKLIQPVRDHFQNDPDAKELLSKIKSW